MLEAALQLASTWPVFPCWGKVPATAHGVKQATQDPRVIRGWWQGEQEGANVAVACGDGLIVLDIDPRAGGDEALAKLLVEHGPLPPTVVVATGGGGRHFYFRGSGRGGRLLAPGVELKAKGQYVIAPPSVHPNGTAYRWEQVAAVGPAELPGWMAGALREGETNGEGGPKAHLSQDNGYIPQGERNRALTALAGAMWRRGTAPEAVLAGLLVENGQRCRPPLEEGEVRRIVGSVTGLYEPAVKGVRKGRLKREDVGRRVREAPEPIEWLVEQRVAQGDIHLMAGPSGVGKSWLSLDMAVAVALGVRVWNAFRVPAGPVVYVDEENTPSEVHRRLHYLAKAWGADPGVLAERLVLLTPNQGFTFREMGLRSELLELVREVGASLVVLDSAIAVSTIADENDSVGVRRFFHECLSPLRQAVGSTVLLLHHVSKAVYAKQATMDDAGLPRGSGDFLAACDSGSLVRPVGGGMRLDSIKVRRGRPRGALFLDIVDGAEGGARPVVVGGLDPEDADEGTSQTQVMGLLEEVGTPMSIGQIHTLLRMKRADYPIKTARSAVYRLVKMGKLKLRDGLYSLE